MSGIIANGRREAVSFGPYAGIAGIAERRAGTEIAFYFADFRSIRDVKTGRIGGIPHTVIKVARSDSVKGMVLLTVVRSQGTGVRGQGTDPQI